MGQSRRTKRTITFEQQLAGSHRRAWHRQGKALSPLDALQALRILSHSSRRFCGLELDGLSGRWQDPQLGKRQTGAPPCCGQWLSSTEPSKLS
jgi:hypothetical protein